MPPGKSGRFTPPHGPSQPLELASGPTRAACERSPRRCLATVNAEDPNFLVRTVPDGLPQNKGRKMAGLAQLCAAFFLGICATALHAEPAQPTLTITAGGVANRFTVAELLSRTDLASVQLPPHVDYSVSLTVQAVPLLDLLASFPLEGFDRLEASATDGFVAQIPLALIEAGKSGGSVAWIAVEDADHPWPKLPGKDGSAGPFYLVWQYPARSRVSNEQWPSSWKN